jgi:thiol-disulfide isomerase/thioredoxin
MRAVSRRVLLCCVLLALAASCHGSAPVGSSIPALNASDAPLLPATADGLPDMNLDGYRRLLAELRGTPAVVNFWGSWCAPCRDEAPDLATLSDRYGSKVQFLGIDILELHRSDGVAFVHEFHWRFPSVFDPSAVIRNGLGYVGQPVTLFYDGNGSLVDQWSGPITPSRFRQGLDRILP